VSFGSPAAVGTWVPVGPWLCDVRISSAVLFSCEEDITAGQKICQPLFVVLAWNDSNGPSKVVSATQFGMAYKLADAASSA
jgi:hypothetical protein